MDVFGDLERLLSEDLYPYRWPLTLAALAAFVAGGWLAWRAGWVARLARWSRQRPLVAGVSVALLLAVVLPTFWVLASRLWTRTTLVEESPLLAAGTLATPAPTEAMTETATPAVTATVDATTPLATAEVSATLPADATIASTAEAALPRVVLEGGWSGADEFHFAEGRALVIETAPGVYTLRVEDFSVRNGPDLFVSPDPLGHSPEAVKLGALKATDGAFNYEIPADVPIESIRSAVVWCDAFAVLFGSASLQ